MSDFDAWVEKRRSGSRGSEGLLDRVRGASPWHLAGVVGVGALAGYWYFGSSVSPEAAAAAARQEQAGTPSGSTTTAVGSDGAVLTVMPARPRRDSPGTLRPNRNKPAHKNSSALANGYYGGAGYGNPFAAAIGPLIGLVGGVANAGIGAAAAGAQGRNQTAMTAQQLEIARVTAEIEAQKSAAQTGIAKTYAAYAAITLASLGLLGTVAYVATKRSSS